MAVWPAIKEPERYDTVMQNEDADARMIFTTTLRKTAAAIELSVNPAQIERMFAHFQLVLQANRQFNLTRITSPQDAAVKHYIDSLTPLKVPQIDSRQPLDVLDVGTGAGFPAIPLAIICPAWRIVAIDATGKKARFVADAAAALGLANVQVEHARAADLARQGERTFDLVLMRAVGKIPEGLSETHSLVRAGGCVVFYKTARIQADETRTSSITAARLRFRELEPIDIMLPSADGPLNRRHIRYERTR